MSTDNAIKLTRLSDGRIVGSCGAAGDCAAFAKWMNDPKGKLKVGWEFGGLVMDSEGHVHLYGQDLHPVRCDLPIAVGSGGDIAVGAMLAGADPQVAVAFACQRDTHSGGVITVMSCEPTA